MVSISLRRVQTHTPPGFSLEWHATEWNSYERETYKRTREGEGLRVQKKGGKEVDLRVF